MMAAITPNSKKRENRPLPLKQRTSSVDARRDYSSNTWRSLLVLLKIREYLITVDNFSIWRRHLAWAKTDGKELKAYMTQRYASNMVFMSLLLSTELGVLMNSSGTTTNVRQQLLHENYRDINFWAGIMLIISVLLTLLGLMSTFTAWGMVNSVGDENAHCIFRSSIGQYAAELPGRFIVCSIYSFLSSFLMFIFILLPIGPLSTSLVCVAVAIFLHVVAAFSAFGRVIMHTGAMANQRIFTPAYEQSLLPHTLHANLLVKAKANLQNNTSITRQYRRKSSPIDKPYSEDELSMQLSDRAIKEEPYRRRADSAVRFADEELGLAPSSTAPRALTPTSENSENNSGGGSFERIMSNDDSVDFENNNNKPPVFRNTISQNGQQSYTTTAPPKPKPAKVSRHNHSNSSMERWLHSVAQPSPTGVSSASENPFTSHEKLLSASSLPEEVTTFRQSSLSTVEGMSREMSEDEQFAHDYGSLFEGDVPATPDHSDVGVSNKKTSNNGSASDENRPLLERNSRPPSALRRTSYGRPSPPPQPNNGLSPLSGDGSFRNN